MNLLGPRPLSRCTNLSPRPSLPLSLSTQHERHSPTISPPLGTGQQHAYEEGQIRPSPRDISELPANRATSAFVDVEPASRHELDNKSPTISISEHPFDPETVSTSNSVGSIVDQDRHPSKSFRCSFCDRIFKTSVSRTTHERQHSSVPEYPCAVPNCAMRFKNKGNLNRHINSVGQIRPQALKRHS